MARAGALAAAGAILPACTGAGPTAARGLPQARGVASEVRGATYRLAAVNGATLPVRFRPLDGVQNATNVQLDSGRVTFDPDGRVRGEWDGTGDVGTGSRTLAVGRLFDHGYVGEAARVLIFSHGESMAPDTATVSGTTLTVRAQFYGRSLDDRYVVTMTYAR